MKKAQIVKEEKVLPNGHRHYCHRLLEKKEVIATFEYNLEPHKLIWITKIEGEANAINTLGKDFFKMCQAGNLNVMSNDLPERKEIIDLLFKQGFKVKNSQVFYSLDLKEFEYKPVETSPFVFKSLDTLDEDLFKDLLYSSVDGDPLSEEISPSNPNRYNNPDCFLQGCKDYPTFNPSHWILAYLENKPVGFILANINPAYRPNVVGGHMEYFSILPSFRKQGFGAQLHYYAMSYLKELGAAIYDGNTSTQNRGMMRLMEKSGCKLTCQFLFFET